METPGEKGEVQLHQEALIADAKAFRMNEQKLLDDEEKRKQKGRQHVAQELKGSLGGSLDQRLQAERTVFVSMKGGARPEVVFTGFWNGKMVNNAQNALARAYRGLRFKDMRENRDKPNAALVKAAKV